MEHLDAPDIHYLNAAIGWLELGDPISAREELARLTPAGAAHPESLEVEWQLLAHHHAWPEALNIARSLVQRSPERASGWIKQSYVLHELKQTAEAYGGLMEVHDQFPNEMVIPYNLACYSCQMGNTTGALDWLKNAIRIGGKATIVDMARRDLDLKPVWPQIDHL